MRIVPDQDPDKVYSMLVESVANINPDVAVKKVSAAKWFLMDRNDRRFDFAVQAYKDGFDKTPYMIRAGGSIGALPILYDAIGKPIIPLPLSLPTDGYHEPNEKFELRQFRGGVDTFLSYFRQVAESAKYSTPACD